MFVVKRIPLIALLLSVTASVFCQSSGVELIRIEGKTMGTTYTVLHFDEKAGDLGKEIDSLLVEVNQGINNYDPASDVSLFNRSANGIPATAYHFACALEKSLHVAVKSEGNFDPTVMPLVNLWGFGPQKNMTPLPSRIDSIKDFVGFAHVSLLGRKAMKDHPNVQVDFGGIGQGYGVDEISRFLRRKKITNYLIELGGEGYAHGKNLATGTSWKIGIVDPLSDKDGQQLMGYVRLDSGAFTTSGNYLNYRIINGKKIGHTISPFTGFPIQQDLISVSVFANDCATADAWATAFMVAGKEKSIEFLQKNPSLAAVLISMEGDKPDIFISKQINNKVFLDPTHDH